jgi:Thioredoxin
LFIAWCAFSKEFLQEYDKVAGNLYKLGELTQSIFFSKINGDDEPELGRQYEIDGYPNIYFEQ